MKLKENAFILADKGYSSKLNRIFLQNKEYKDAIMFKANSGKKLNDYQKFKNKIISKKSIVEHLFGIFKRIYRFILSLYLAILKSNGQLLMSCLSFNFKKASTFKTKLLKSKKLLLISKLKY